MKNKSMKLISAILALSMGAAAFTACASDETPVHTHRLFDREAVAATCITDGNIEYKECLYCGDVFVDGKEVEREDLVLAADPALHQMEHHEETAATCLKNGNVDYYQCTVCENTFTDAAGQTPVEETVVYGKHVLKTVAAGEATCYSKEHTEHTVCEVCHKVVLGEEVTNENNSSLDAVYTGDTLEHNFVEGVCANAGCGAKQVKASTAVTVGTDAEDVTAKAYATPGSWQALKGEEDTATVTAGESAITLNLASDSAVRLATVPAKETSAFVGVYELSFDLKVTNYKAEDEDKTLRIGFSLRSAAGAGNGDIVNSKTTERITAVDGVYHINLLIEAATAEQLLQIELGNAGLENTDKTVELSEIAYTFYPEAAKTFVNRLEVSLPDNMPEAISYTVDRINSDSEGSTKVPLGQWRYYQANNSRKAGAIVTDNYGKTNSMSITFAGYFGTKNTERLYYRPNAPVGSKVNIKFSLTMSMDGSINLANAASGSYNLKAGVAQEISASYTVSSSNYLKLELTINDVKNKAFPEGGSCTFDITDVTVEIDTSALVHTMEAKVEAKDATCTEAGNLAYYHCTHCDKYFSDELGNTDITATYSIPALGHDMTHFEAVAQSTCYEKSHAEYYHCNTCKLYFSDEQGANKLETVEFGEKLEHNYVDGVCTNAGCGAKQVGLDTIEAKEGAIGNDGNAIKETLITNPGTWAVQYNDTNSKVSVTGGSMQIEIPNHASNQRAAWIRYIPASEGAAFIGAYRIYFDMVVTKSGTNTTGNAQLQVGFSIQNRTATLAGDTGSAGEEIKEFEIGKTYRFAAYLETLTADDFFQFTVRNIKADPAKAFTISNVVVVYEPAAAKTGSYVVERLAFAEKVETTVPETEAVVPENKSEYAE